MVLNLVFVEERLPRWRVIVADGVAVKDLGWRTGRYHRILRSAVVSGSVVNELDAKYGKILMSKVWFWNYIIIK